MLGNSNYIDLTGQMEEVFDSKIQQISFVSEDKVKEIVAEAKIEPVETGVYLKKTEAAETYSNKSHTHSVLDNISVESIKTNNNLFQINAGANYDGYVVLRANHDTGGSIYIRQFDTKGTQRNSLTLLDNNGNMHAPKNFSTYTLTVRKDADINGNLNINGDLYVKGVKIDGSGGGTVEIPDVINKNLSITGNLTTEGQIVSSNKTHTLGNFTIIDKQTIRFFNPSMLENNKCYIELGKELNGSDGSFWIHYVYPGVAGLGFQGDMNMIKFTYADKKVDINANLYVKGDVDISSAEYVYGPGFQMNSTEISLFKELNCENTGAYFGGNVNIDGDLYVNGVKIDGSNGGSGTTTIPDRINKSITISGDLTVNGDVDISSAEYLYGPGFQMNSNEISLFKELNCENTGAYFGGNVGIGGDLTLNSATLKAQQGNILYTSTAALPSFSIGDVIYLQYLKSTNMSKGIISIAGLQISSESGSTNQTLKILGDVNVVGKLTSNNSTTITHKTNVQGEIGTFCETNGGIYDKYDEITETDCICQVVQSNTLNSRIVGIITDKDQFASHGDVLVKIVPGTYHLGDILCPDITGKARIATETELQYMMLHAIPRPKITSLDTKIEGTVACFIV